MKKVLITGANGLLGQKLVGLFANSQDYTLVASSRGENRIPNKDGYTYVPLDITQEHQVEIMLQEIEPDVVINTAAMTNVDACESDHDGCRALNVDAVKYLVKACITHNAHLIHLSTDFIFDGEDGPYSEEDQANPVSFYGQSKLGAEQVVVQSALKEWTILRTILLYGVIPNSSRSNIVLWAKGALEKGDPIKVVDDQFRSPTLVEDLANACFAAADRRKFGVYHISGPEMMSIIDLVMRVGEYFRYDTSNITTVSSATLNQPAMRPPKTGFVLDKARRELGYTPHTLEQGLAVVSAQLEAS